MQESHELFGESAFWPKLGSCETGLGLENVCSGTTLDAGRSCVHNATIPLFCRHFWRYAAVREGRPVPIGQVCKLVNRFLPLLCFFGLAASHHWNCCSAIEGPIFTSTMRLSSKG